MLIVKPWNTLTSIYTMHAICKLYDMREILNQVLNLKIQNCLNFLIGLTYFIK